MLNRRFFIAAAAALTLSAGAASAQDWKAQYPELVFAIIPAENPLASRTVTRRSSAISPSSSAPR